MPVTPHKSALYTVARLKAPSFNVGNVPVVKVFSVQKLFSGLSATTSCAVKPVTVVKSFVPSVLLALLPISELFANVVLNPLVPYVRPVISFGIHIDSFVSPKAVGATTAPSMKLTSAM